MNILILHRVPYDRIEYDRGIDHDLHTVVYFGIDSALSTIPTHVSCERVRRAGCRSAYEEASEWLMQTRRHFDRVISMSEYELLDAARLREDHNVPGARVDQVALARDKVLMKGAVDEAGLRIPRFLSAAQFVNNIGEASWKNETVVKPTRGASSENVLVFDTVRQAHSAIVEGRLGIDCEVSELEVEEFISGPVRHFDGLVQNGELLALSASEYVGTCLDYAQGSPMGSFQIDHTAEVRSWVAQVLAAVQVHDGSFHLEAIVHDQALVFLEVGNRVGGADVVATFELATGIHLPSLELRILLGESIREALPSPPSSGRRYGWFVHPGHHLAGRKYLGLSGTSDQYEDSSVVSWTELPVGSTMPELVTYSAGETVLAGIVAGDTPCETRDWIVNLFDSLVVHSVPADAPAASAR